MSLQADLANTQSTTSRQAKRVGKHQHEAVFGTLDAFLAALENAEVMIAKITQNSIPRGRGTGVTQRHYGVHLTALGPIHGTSSPIYYCTILVASQSVFANRSFCPSPQARTQHESCLQQQEEVYQQLVTLLQTVPNVTRVLEDARLLVRDPWVSPVLWASVSTPVNENG